MNTISNQIRFTVLQTQSETNKTYYLKNNKLDKLQAGEIYLAVADIITVNTPKEHFDFINEARFADTNYALISGTPKNNISNQILVATENKVQGDDKITRTKDDFHFDVNTITPLLIDQDDLENNDGLFLDTIKRINPDYANINFATSKFPSNSCGIFNAQGDLLTHQNKSHTYIYAINTHLITEEGRKNLIARLMLNGDVYANVNKIGAFEPKLKSCDVSPLLQPERLEFFQSAILKDGLVSKPFEPVFTDGELIDLSLPCFIAPLTSQEMRNLNVLKDTLRNSVKNEIEAIKGKLIDKKTKEYVEKGLEFNTAKNKAKQWLHDLHKAEVNKSTLVKFKDGTYYTIEDVLKDIDINKKDSKFYGSNKFYPVGDENRDNACAGFTLVNDKISFSSFSSGGIRYTILDEVGGTKFDIKDLALEEGKFDLELEKVDVKVFQTKEDFDIKINQCTDDIKGKNNVTYKYYNNDVEKTELIKSAIEHNQIALLTDTTGTGKTNAVLAGLKEVLGKRNLLLTAPFNSLISDLTQRFTEVTGLQISSHLDKENMEIAHYFDNVDEGLAVKQTAFVTTLDSMCKFEKDIKGNQVVFADELSMTLGRLANGMIGDKEQSGAGDTKQAGLKQFELLTKLFADKTNSFLIADAFITPDHLNGLVENREVVVIASKYVKPRSKAFYHIKDKTSMRLIYKDFLTNKDTVQHLIVGSIKEGDLYLQQAIDAGRTACFFNGNLKENDKTEMLNDIKDFKFDVIITTSALVTGVSLICPEGKVAQVLNFDNTNNTNHEMIIQASDRIRNAVAVYSVVKFKKDVVKNTYDDFINLQVSKSYVAHNTVNDNPEVYKVVRNAVILMLNKSRFDKWKNDYRLNEYLKNDLNYEEFNILLDRQGYVDIHEVEDNNLFEDGSEDFIKQEVVAHKKEVKMLAKQKEATQINDILNDAVKVNSIREFFNLTDDEEVTVDLVRKTINEDCLKKQQLMYKFLTKPCENTGNAKRRLKQFLKGEISNVTEALIVDWLKSLVKLERDTVNGGYKKVVLDREKVLATYAKTHDSYIKAIKGCGLVTKAAGDTSTSALKSLSLLLSNFNVEMSTNNGVSVITLDKDYNLKFMRNKQELVEPEVKVDMSKLTSMKSVKGLKIS